MRSRHTVSGAPMSWVKSVEREVTSSPSRRGAYTTDESEKTTVRLYCVQIGDTLRSIAERFYGSELSWPSLYLANKWALQGLDRVSPGQILYIPELK